MLKTDFPLQTRWTKFTLPSEKKHKIKIVYIKKIVFKTLDIRQQRKVIPEDWTASKTLPRAAWRASQSRPRILIRKTSVSSPTCYSHSGSWAGQRDCRVGLGVLPGRAPGRGAQEHDMRNSVGLGRPGPEALLLSSQLCGTGQVASLSEP